MTRTAIPLLSVVVPTIPGREQDLERTIAAYERLTLGGIEWIIERGHDNCGAAWNAGAARANGRVLHLTADDIEPASDDWLLAALEALAGNGVPIGLIHEGGRSFGRDFCRVPTCLRSWWRDVPACHYYSDNAFTDLMAQAGHPAVPVDGYDFHHRRSMVGRDESPGRLARDLDTYLRKRP